MSPLNTSYLWGWMHESIGILLPSPVSLKSQPVQAYAEDGKVKSFLASMLNYLLICISLCSSREARLSTGHRN